MRYLITVLCCAIIISCNKTGLPNTTGSTLSRVDSYYPDGSLIYTAIYTYTTQNKLLQLSTGSVKYAFAYNPQGQLSSITLKTNSNVVMLTFSFTHDANGKIIKKTTIPGTTGVSGSRSYAYDASGRIVADSQYTGTSTSVSRYSKYTYDNNGNISKHELYTWNGSGFISNTQTFEYDNKLNPYYQISNELYFTNESASYLSRANQVDISSDFMHKNKYYSNGLLRIAYYRDPFWDVYQKAEFTYTQP